MSEEKTYEQKIEEAVSEKQWTIQNPPPNLIPIEDVKKLLDALNIYARSEYVDVKSRGRHLEDGSEFLDIDDDGTIARQALEELKTKHGELK